MSQTITFKTRDTQIDYHLTVSTKGRGSNYSTTINTDLSRPAIWIDMPHDQAVKFTKQNYDHIHAAYRAYEHNLAVAAQVLRTKVEELAKKYTTNL